MTGLQTVGRWANAAGCLVWLVSAAVAWAEPAAEGEVSEEDYRRAEIAREARNLKVTIGHDEGEAKLIDEPVLRWTSPRGGSGATFLWTNGKLPVAMCCIWWAPDKQSMHLAFHSLTEKPVMAQQASNIIWHSDKPGVAYERLPDANAPADSAKSRLTQMRNIARDFKAEMVRFGQQNPEELRLLPQPLYRYGGDDSGVEDGAVFAFVCGTDPELILHVEASPNRDGTLRWRYALTRRTSAELRVHYDSKVVWTVRATNGSFDEPFYVRPAR